MLSAKMKLLKKIEDKPLPKDGYAIRNAVRVVAVDENGFTPIIDVTKFGYHKILGGGIKEGETPREALVREAIEEGGCQIVIGEEVGRIEEYRSEFGQLQISECYLGKIIGKGETHFEPDEVAEGFVLTWMELSEVIALCESDDPIDYEAKFIRERDLTFLKEAQKLLKPGYN
jgi:8-oxo-dGTP pyrophosphatase MutT (NUDIX family)